MNCIWLNKEKYPQYQKSYQTLFCDKTKYNFCVAEFKKNYTFEKNISKIKTTVCADTKYELNINGDFVGSGPVYRGGDYGFKSAPSYTYSDFYELPVTGTTLNFYAAVRLLPHAPAESSLGFGRFALDAEIVFTDGTHIGISADSSWLSRKNAHYLGINKFDYAADTDEWAYSDLVPPFPELRPSPLAHAATEKIISENPMQYVIGAGEKSDFTVMFDKIYSAYAYIDISAGGHYDISINFFEIPDKITDTEHIHSEKSITHKSLLMRSMGGYTVHIENLSTFPITVNECSLIYEHYPIIQNGNFECSNEVLNKIYEVGKHTLAICRQSIELDSPIHTEPLGCTGDYFIESLINYFTFGDTALTRLDIIRTADYLRSTGGIMFHTTYSLIYIQMIYDYYMFSADRRLLSEVCDVIKLLIKVFDGYIGDTGLIENPPNFMFADWIFADGYSMHHPPKALGQTILNAFYFKALLTAAEIFEILGDNDAGICRKHAESLHIAFNKHLYDKKRGLYFDGLNTPSIENKWLPKNPEKRYYSMHSNTLAVLYGLCPASECERIMTAVLNDASLITVQPYFMHFVLEAIYKSGLFDRYGLQQILRYRDIVNECGKGLKEGWIDMPGYGYDYSHAWGATPTYQLPSKLLGFKMIEPGFKKISLSPKLFGLEYANISIPTPYGYIKCEMNKNEIKLDVPNEIQVE